VFKRFPDKSIPLKGVDSDGNCLVASCSGWSVHVAGHGEFLKGAILQGAFGLKQRGTIDGARNVQG
jgi:hypothetical protein